MAKKVVKNSSNEPIYLNLPDGRSLKIPARGEVEVDEAEVASNDLALHMSRGDAFMTGPEEKGEPAEAAASGGGEGARGQESETSKETGSERPGGAKEEEGGKG
jgi:hypothetical protein